MRRIEIVQNPNDVEGNVIVRDSYAHEGDIVLGQGNERVYIDGKSLPALLNAIQALTGVETQTKTKTKTPKPKPLTARNVHVGDKVVMDENALINQDGQYVSCRDVPLTVTEVEKRSEKGMIVGISRPDGTACRMYLKRLRRA